MDLTEGLARELEEKAEENEGDPRALLEILYDLTTWSDDEITGLQRKIIDRVSAHLNEPSGWPEPDSSFSEGKASEEKGGLDTDGWPDVGLLKKLGYTTGKHGKNRFKRRAILRRSLQVDADEWLPIKEHAEEWGEPKSEERLKKVANSLSAFAGMEKKKEKPAKLAISHWEADLEYLKEWFYDPDHSFDWPSMDVLDAGPDGGKHPELPFEEE